MFATLMDDQRADIAKIDIWFMAQVGAFVHDKILR